MHISGTCHDGPSIGLETNDGAGGGLRATLVTSALALASHGALPRKGHLLHIEHQGRVRTTHVAHEERNCQTILAIAQVDEELLVDLVHAVEVGVAMHVERAGRLGGTAGVLDGLARGVKVEEVPWSRS